MNFLGGGVAVFSGVVWVANFGALANFGAGFFIFEGAGVLVISGGVFTMNTGAGK